MQGAICERVFPLHEWKALKEGLKWRSSKSNSWMKLNPPWLNRPSTLQLPNIYAASPNVHVEKPSSEIQGCEKQIQLGLNVGFFDYLY